MLFSNSGESSSSPNSDDEISKVLVQGIETSYVRVWLALLSSGLGTEYENAIKDFITFAIGAYEKGYTLPGFLLELSHSSTFRKNAEKLGLSQEQVSKASLSEADQKAREYWLTLVFSTLAYMRHMPPNPPPAPPSDPLGFQNMVRYVVEQRKKGFSLEGMKLEQRLSNSLDSGINPDRAQAFKESNLTPAQSSIRSQWMRIVFLTADVIDQRKKQR
eukprot:CAMPEP_0184692640 /NCGR_PEP_ID=MMETSP0313-20130426/1035_1 /TAXON_ID=2792 /ORGANISM="Porphyridium aerugineum, Strain SAG 1380-2" /LENGTH=216 /DNA_ID=CAMNT_0027150483 /DNA_START=182 /DNA_END=832 /DNA_ORIENTATION=+